MYQNNIVIPILQILQILLNYRAMLSMRGTSHGPVSVSVRMSQVGVL